MLSAAGALAGRLGRYALLTRPFTLLAPAVGMVAGGVAAAGAVPSSPSGAALASSLLLGALMAALLNAGSNALNQICDLDIDRVNRPERMLPSGRVSVVEARWLALLLYLLALVVAATVNLQCFVIAVGGAISSVAYSLPPLRTKRLLFGSNLTIATSRGLLLLVCGWSTVASVLTPEPWCIGAVFFLFVVGAASTKDFADVAGDARYGCQTLPVRFGHRKAALLMAPSLVLPFLLLPVGARCGLLSGDRGLLTACGLGLALWGAVTGLFLVRDPESLARSTRRGAWVNMYLMMMAAQLALVVAYGAPLCK